MQNKNPSIPILNTDFSPAESGYLPEDFSEITFKLPVLQDIIKVPPSSRPADSPYEQDPTIHQRLGLHYPIRPIPGLKFPIYAIPFQKILIVQYLEHDRQGKALLTENSHVTLPFTPYNGNSPVDLLVRVIRVCEYHNPDDEYLNAKGKPIPTNTVLIEWENTNPAFGTFAVGQAGILMTAQTDNLVIKEKPNGKPGPPILDAAPAVEFVVTDSDFEKEPPQGSFQPFDAKTPVVAVLDTGLRTNFPATDVLPAHEYQDRNGISRTFLIAEAPSVIPNKYGYCAVTEYMRASSESLPASRGFLLDEHYRQISEYACLHDLSKADIRNSPFDDNLLTDTQGNKGGRHGTIISAIINQKGNAAVLPVKVFNQGGFGTLYDLLCGLNYIIACKRNGLNIRVINMSFAGQLHKSSHQLVHNKFRILEKEQIWAVVAAGNEGKELVFDHFNTTPPSNGDQLSNLFPACFSTEFDNVITVTGVKVDLWKLEPRKDAGKTAMTALLSHRTQNSILTQLGIPRKHYRLVPATYEVADTSLSIFYNYSKEFVNLGVVGPFSSVFENAEPAHHGTSFAVAFFSAKLIDHLQRYANHSRCQIFRALTYTGAVAAGKIQGNRLINYNP